jgi:hypothetical protein
MKDPKATQAMHRGHQREENIPLHKIAKMQARFDQRAKNLKLGYEDEILVTEFFVVDSNDQSLHLWNQKFS